MIPRLLHAALLLLLAAGLPARAAETDLEAVRKEGLAAIRAARARAHVAFLAGPKCEGRASGEAGCERAAEYLVAALGELGVEPAGTKGFLQEFPIRGGPFPGQRRRVEGAPETKPSANVIGVLRGSDPALSKEAVILGGHYDHIGYEDLKKGKVYWGADDNASGTSAVLLVAEGFAACSVRPRRSVIFLFFTGEERGLLGSRHYVGAPTWPLADTVFMLNLDMVSRNDPPRMDVYGRGVSPEVDALNDELEREAKFRFEYRGGSIFQRSDHYSFYEKGIPVLFFTSGLHKDYHDLDDEPKKANFGKIERIAAHAFRLAFEIANRDARPTFSAVPASGAAGRLGFLPVALSATEAGTLGLKKAGAVEVGEVKEGGPAAAAGLAKGEIVIAFAGKTLDEDDPISDLDSIADKLPAGAKVPITVLRDGRPKTLAIGVP